MYLTESSEFRNFNPTDAAPWIRSVFAPDARMHEARRVDDSGSNETAVVPGHAATVQGKPANA